MSHELPDSSPYVVLGGGVHGLSSAYHLALALEESGKGSGRDVIVLEKNHLGAGASGIACGVVRNFYFSPAMAEVIRVSVELFESDPAGFGFHGVGYIAAVPAVQAEDVVAIQKHQAEIGYRSDVILGERACQAHMEAIFPDWNGAGHRGRPARAAGRLGRDDEDGREPRAPRTLEGRPHLRGRRGDRLRPARRPRPRGRDRPGLDRRPSSSSPAQARGAATSGGCSGSRPRCASRARTSPRRRSARRRWLKAEGNGTAYETKPIVTYWKLQEGDYWLDDVDLTDAGRP